MLAQNQKPQKIRKSKTAKNPKSQKKIKNKNKNKNALSIRITNPLGDKLCMLTSRGPRGNRPGDAASKQQQTLARSEGRDPTSLGPTNGNK